MASSLLLLPNEILLLIAARLPHPQYVSALMRTCHRLSHLLSVLFRTLALADKDNASALHWAAKRGHLPLVRLALSAGADIDLVNDENMLAPLYLAAWSGHERICEFLLDFGADVNQPNLWWETPLHRAAEERHAGVVRVLLDRGADPNSVDDEGGTPLHFAVHGARRAEVGIVEMLLERGADPGVRNKYMWLPVDCQGTKDERVTEVLMKAQERFSST